MFLPQTSGLLFPDLLADLSMMRKIAAFLYAKKVVDMLTLLSATSFLIN
jgi:hypothetical protein